MEKFLNLDKLIPSMRREYTAATLEESAIAGDPFEQFGKWFLDAVNAKCDLPNAMTLATSGKSGQPSARTLLLKGFDREGFIFYTDYRSLKARDLRDNPNAALVFFWPQLDRQVIIRGGCVKSDAGKGAEYFQSRPKLAQIAAAVSVQSSVIPGREVLEAKYREMDDQYRNRRIPMPAEWGGYLLKPREFEFFQGRENRLNDRIRFTMKSGGGWNLERLSP